LMSSTVLTGRTYRVSTSHSNLKPQPGRGRLRGFRILPPRSHTVHNRDRSPARGSLNGWGRSQTRGQPGCAGGIHLHRQH
jgi:hypothetical protein